MLFYLKEKFKSEFADPVKFKKDLLGCYISGFFVDEIRNIYTAKEREAFLKKQNPNKSVKNCDDPKSFICLKHLQTLNNSEHPQKFNVFRTSNVLSNLKFYHFYKNDLRVKKVSDKTTVMQLSPSTSSHSSYVPEALVLGEKKLSSNGPKEHQILSPRPTDSTKRRTSISETNTANLDTFDPNEIMIERHPHICKFQLCEDFVHLKLKEKKEKLVAELQLIENGVIDNTLESLHKYYQRNSRAHTPSIEESPRAETTFDRFDSDDDMDDLSILDIIRASENTDSKSGKHSRKNTLDTPLSKYYLAHSGILTR